MAARLNSVRSACKMDPEQRTEQHISDIVEFVKDVKFFTKLTNLQQRALCRTMTHEVFAPREYIFQKDDIGDKFYIILAGSVSVQIPSTTQCPNGIHTERCDCPNRPFETVVYLEQGMGFGELALQSDQPRSASIQTSEITETLVTKRTDYEQYAGQLHRQFIEQRVKFLRQFPRIEDALQRCLVSTQDIAAMANCLSEVGFSGSEMVVRQGDVVESMIFVRKGQLAMLRLVDPDNLCEANGAPLVGDGQESEAATRPEGEPGPSADGSPSGRDKEAKNAAAAERHTKVTWATTLALLMLEEKRKMAEEPLRAANPSKRSPGVVNFLAAQRERARPQEVEASAKAERMERSETMGRRMSVSETMGRRMSMSETMGRRMSMHQSQGGVALPREDSNHSTRAQRLWKRLRGAFRLARSINRLRPVDGQWVKDQGGGEQDAGMKHLSQMMDVSAARKKYAEYRSKELTQERLKGKSQRKRPGARRAGTDSLAKGPTRRKILRIGTVGAFQYFGDRQVINGGCYPVSLVSDPVAEIYLMSKHDIQRRLPKKLFAALFTPEKEAVPNDAQVLDMHRQTERWNLFRRSLHGEAMVSRSGSSAAAARSSSSASGPPRGLRQGWAEGGPRTGFGRNAGSCRNDPLSNLDFLGVSPESVPEVIPVPRPAHAPLTAHDEVFFSQTSADFLRKFELLGRDQELRAKLLKDGAARRHFGLHGFADENTEPDPNAFRFDRHWAKLGKFSMGLDPMTQEEPAAAAMAERSRGREQQFLPSPQQQPQQQYRAATAGAPHGGGAGSPVVSFEKQQQLVGRPPVSRGSMPSGGSMVAEKNFGAFPQQPTHTCSTELPPLSSARSLGISSLSANSSGAVGFAATAAPETARGSVRRKAGPAAAMMSSTG